MSAAGGEDGFNEFGQAVMEALKRLCPKLTTQQRNSMAEVAWQQGYAMATLEQAVAFCAENLGGAGADETAATTAAAAGKAADEFAPAEEPAELAAASAADPLAETAGTSGDYIDNATAAIDVPIGTSAGLEAEAPGRQPQSASPVDPAVGSIAAVRCAPPSAQSDSAAHLILDRRAVESNVSNESWLR